MNIGNQQCKSTNQNTDKYSSKGLTVKANLKYLLLIIMHFKPTLTHANKTTLNQLEGFEKNKLKTSCMKLENTDISFNQTYPSNIMDTLCDIKIEQLRQTDQFGAAFKDIGNYLQDPIWTGIHQKKSGWINCWVNKVSDNHFIKSLNGIEQAELNTGMRLLNRFPSKYRTPLAIGLINQLQSYLKMGKLDQNFELSLEECFFPKKNKINWCGFSEQNIPFKLTDKYPAYEKLFTLTPILIIKQPIEVLKNIYNSAAYDSTNYISNIINKNIVSILKTIYNSATYDSTNHISNIIDDIVYLKLEFIKQNGFEHNKELLVDLVKTENTYFSHIHTIFPTLLPYQLFEMGLPAERLDEFIIFKIKHIEKYHEEKIKNKALNSFFSNEASKLKDHELINTYRREILNKIDSLISNKNNHLLRLDRGGMIDVFNKIITTFDFLLPHQIESLKCPITILLSYTNSKIDNLFYKEIKFKNIHETVQNGIELIKQLTINPNTQRWVTLDEKGVRKLFDITTQYIHHAWPFINLNMLNKNEQFKLLNHIFTYVPLNTIDKNNYNVALKCNKDLILLLEKIQKLGSEFEELYPANTIKKTVEHFNSFINVTTSLTNLLHDNQHKQYLLLYFAHEYDELLTIHDLQYLGLDVSFTDELIQHRFNIIQNEDEYLFKEIKIIDLFLKNTSHIRTESDLVEIDDGGWVDSASLILTSYPHLFPLFPVKIIHNDYKSFFLPLVGTDINLFSIQSLFNDINYTSNSWNQYFGKTLNGYLDKLNNNEIENFYDIFSFQLNHVKETRAKENDGILTITRMKTFLENKNVYSKDEFRKQYLTFLIEDYLILKNNQQRNKNTNQSFSTYILNEIEQHFPYGTYTINDYLTSMNINILGTGLVDLFFYNTKAKETLIPTVIKLLTDQNSSSIILNLIQQEIFNQEKKLTISPSNYTVNDVCKLINTLIDHQPNFINDISNSSIMNQMLEDINILELYSCFPHLNIRVNSPFKYSEASKIFKTTLIKSEAISIANIVIFMMIMSSIKHYRQFKKQQIISHVNDKINEYNNKLTTYTTSNDIQFKVAKDVYNLNRELLKLNKNIYLSKKDKSYINFQNIIKNYEDLLTNIYTSIYRDERERNIELTIAHDKISYELLKNPILIYTGFCYDKQFHEEYLKKNKREIFPKDKIKPVVKNKAMEALLVKIKIHHIARKKLLKYKTNNN